MRGSRWGIFHHWAVGKLNSTGSWCTKLSNYMGGWCPRKLNFIGGWVKKKVLCSTPRYFFLWNSPTPGRVAQSVMCLATDACLTAIPGVASSILARSHTFVEIDHEIISTVILLPSADTFKKGCCQLQAKVCARITGYPLVQACPGKSVVR